MAYQRYLEQLQEANNNAANLQNLVNEQFEEKKAEIGEKARIGEDILEGVLGFETLKGLKKGIDAYRKSRKARRDRQNQENENQEQDMEGEEDGEEDIPVEEEDLNEPIGEGAEGDLEEWGGEVGDYAPDVIGEGLMGGTAQQRLLDEDPEAHLDLTGEPLQPAEEAPAPEAQPAPEADPPVDDPADVGADLPEHPNIFTDEGHQQALDEIEQNRANRRARFEDNAQEQAGEAHEAGEGAEEGEAVGEDLGEDLGEDIAEDVGIGAVLGPVGEVAAVAYGLFQTFKSLFDEHHVHKPKLPAQAGISLSATDVDIPTTAEI